MIKHSESSRFFEDISRNTGMSNNEIEKNLKEKKDVLLWLIKNKIRALESFGKTMNLYYSNKEELLKDVSNNNIKRILKTEEDSKEQKISTHPKQN